MGNIPEKNVDFKTWNDNMIRKHSPDNFHKKSPLPIKIIEKQRVKSILKYLEIKQTDKVLELGCGAANILTKVNSENKFGADISKYILEKAKINAPEVKFVQGDIQTLFFKKNYFDKIICSEALEHLPDPEKVADNAYKLLKESGIFVVTVPIEKNIQNIKKIIMKLKLSSIFSNKSYSFDEIKISIDEWHLHNLNFDEWLNILTKKFKLISYSGIPVNIFPFRYVFKLKK
ncbi:class I SAM-dependent methyltransferase [Candidatus Dependentiae bacterium]|nr:class I SAM-dependent methyltransferase [Candidatus Dependentiae bacterium]